MPPQDLEFNEAENHADTDNIDEDADSNRKNPPQQDKGVRHLSLVVAVLNCPKTCRVNMSWSMFRTPTRSAHAANQNFVKWGKAPVKTGVPPSQTVCRSDTKT